MLCFVAKIKHKLDTYELLLQNNAWCFENGQSTIKTEVEVTVDNVATKEVAQTGHAVVVTSEIEVKEIREQTLYLADSLFI